MSMSEGITFDDDLAGYSDGLPWPEDVYVEDDDETAAIPNESMDQLVNGGGA